MTEVLQGLLDNGAKATRNSINQLLKKYMKPAGISAEAPAGAPLAVIDVKMLWYSPIWASFLERSKIKNVPPSLVETCTRFYVYHLKSLACESVPLLYTVTRPKNIVQLND